MNLLQARWIYERQDKVRFGHCDPAGIVFFPRYFEMLNSLVEDWFTDGLGIDYHALIGTRRIGLPTVHLGVDFQRISRMGDVLTQRLGINKLGRSSLGLDIQFTGDDGVRLALQQVLVCTSLDTHKPIALPDDVRTALERRLSAPQEEPSS
jgi:4-hydroxybenzoyl-CoA thioesterase